MSNPVVVTEIRNRAMWIRLNRPEAMNSLNPQVLRELDLALDEAQRNAEVVCVVLTGTGRAFCAGADLKHVRSEFDAVGSRDFLGEVERVFNRLERLPKPVIAALNGITLAGGLELLLCCDLVVAAASAVVGDAHANYGLLPGGGSSVRLPRVIGSTRAKYLLFTGDSLPAAKMQAAGLINQVVDDPLLEDACQAIADKMATKSPLGLRRMKALVDDGMDQPKDTALRLELLACEVHAMSDDQREGLAAFQEKRVPRFAGR